MELFLDYYNVGNGQHFISVFIMDFNWTTCPSVLSHSIGLTRRRIPLVCGNNGRNESATRYDVTSDPPHLLLRLFLLGLERFSHSDRVKIIRSWPIWSTAAAALKKSRTMWCRILLIKSRLINTHRIIIVNLIRMPFIHGSIFCYAPLSAFPTELIRNLYVISLGDFSGRANERAS